MDYTAVFGWHLGIFSDQNSYVGLNLKAFGFTVRCLKD
jgi:hypothetical protein